MHPKVAERFAPKQERTKNIIRKKKKKKGENEKNKENKEITAFKTDRK